MKGCIARIRTRCAGLADGLTEGELAAAGQRLGGVACPALVELYKDHDGMPVDSPLPMRSMTMAEILETNDGIRRQHPSLLPEGALLVWTDDNSNYAGVFLGGALAYRVFLLDHEEPDTTPRFRSAERFVAAMLDSPEAYWRDLEPDYPRLAPAKDFEADEAEADRQLGHRFLDAYRADPGEAASAFVALALLPPDDNAYLVPLLQSDDMWVQERTCEVLGLRRYGKAVDDLVAVARTGKHNGRLASVRALQRIGSRAAGQALRQLEKEIGEQYSSLFRPRKT